MHISNRIISIRTLSNYFKLCRVNHIHTKQRTKTMAILDGLCWDTPLWSSFRATRAVMSDLDVPLAACSAPLSAPFPKTGASHTGLPSLCFRAIFRFLLSNKFRFCVSAVKRWSQSRLQLPLTLLTTTGQSHTILPMTPQSLTVKALF